MNPLINGFLKIKFMDSFRIIDEHIVIRETVGYDFIKDVEIEDLPQVIKFLKIVFNYENLCSMNK